MKQVRLASFPAPKMRIRKGSVFLAVSSCFTTPTHLLCSASPECMVTFKGRNAGCHLLPLRIHSLFHSLSCLPIQSGGSVQGFCYTSLSVANWFHFIIHYYTPSFIDRPPFIFRLSFGCEMVLELQLPSYQMRSNRWKNTTNLYQNTTRRFWPAHFQSILTLTHYVDFRQ